MIPFWGRKSPRGYSGAGRWRKPLLLPLLAVLAAVLVALPQGPAAAQSPPAVSAVSVSVSSLNSAVATLSIENHDGTLTTFHVRYRPSADTTWTTETTSSSTETATHAITGLTPSTEYQLLASAARSFPNTDATKETTFTTLANNAPAFTAAEISRSIYENTAPGYDVGDPLTATDHDIAQGDSISYTLGGTDAASFSISSATGQLTVGTGVVVDYETKTSYSVTVTASDLYSGTATIAVTVQVVDIDEVGLLSRLVFVVGAGSGGRYGYSSTDSYGTLESGDFNRGLLADDTDRTVAQVYEDNDGFWYLYYSGGDADQWLSDQGALDAITVTVLYEDGRDERNFVLGGFIEEVLTGNGLKLDPPIPARDWASRETEEVAIEFRHRGQVITPPGPGVLTEPLGEEGSFVEFLSETTPGGPVMAQTMMVIMVYAVFIFKAPASPWGIIAAAVVLVMTPWVPVLFGYGSTMAGGIVLVNMVAGAYSFKVFAARTE